MTEVKDILLKIQAQAGNAVNEIAELTTKVSKLRDEERELKKAMDILRSANQTESEQYKELARELATNTEQQKAYKKEINEVSREVQNTIVKNGKYEDTLKGLCAQLSIEKDLLRKTKLENGEKSKAYEEQEKKVSALNERIKEMEREYGTHTRNVGNYESAVQEMFGKFKLSWVALATAIVAGVKEFAEDFVNATQKMGDKWGAEVAGWKSAYNQFIVGLQRGDGFRELINNMRTSYSEAKKFFNLLDELFERNNALSIKEAEYAEKIEDARVKARDTTLPAEERIKYAEEAITLEKELAEEKADIAKQELEARKGELQVQTKMNDAEIEFIINKYNENKEVINQANEYNSQLEELEKTYNRLNRAASTSPDGTGSIFQDQITEVIGEINALNANTGDEVKAVAEMVAKYNLSNDDLVTNYVNAYNQYTKVNADFIRQTSRFQLNISTAKKQIENETKKQTETADKVTAADTTATAGSGIDTSALTTFVGSASAILSKGDDKTQIENKYAKVAMQLKAVVQQGLMSFEEANYYRVVLAQKMHEELEQAEQKHNDKVRQQEEQAVRERADQLQTDLQLAWDNEQAKFDIKRKYLEDEIALAEEGTKRRAELEEQLANLTAQHTQKKIDKLTDFVQDCGKLIDEFGGTLDNLDAHRLEQDTATNETQKENLKKRLDAGLISQKSYDTQVAKLDAELDRKKADIARRQAIRERALSVFEIAVNTAKAIAKIWAEVPKFDYGVSTGVLTALAVAMGAAQTASVLSAPMPKARKGGLVQGATHEAGGVLINTENDERIIGANPSRAFPELLNLISYIGKNIPNTGYAERQMITSVTGGAGAGIDYQQMKQAMREAVQELRIYTSLTELREAEQMHTTIDNLSKL